MLNTNRTQKKQDRQDYKKEKQLRNKLSNECVAARYNITSKEISSKENRCVVEYSVDEEFCYELCYNLIDFCDLFGNGPCANCECVFLDLNHKYFDAKRKYNEQKQKVKSFWKERYKSRLNEIQK